MSIVARIESRGKTLRPRGIDKANARLLAAAPELLDALREMLKAVELVTPDAPEPLPESVIGKARATIAKATRCHKHTKKPMPNHVTNKLTITEDDNK